MLDALKPHSAYKPCHQWIGDVPSHWDVVPGFAAFREKQVKNTGMAVSDVLSLSYGRIVVKPPEKLHGLVPASFETYQIVDPGDIIIRPTDLQNDWHSIRVGLSSHRGIITSAYICLKPTALMTPAYCHLLLLAYDMLKFFYGMGSGLRQSLDYSDFRRFPMLVPPSAEQAGIVRFLGAVDRRVNGFSRAKRRLIEVLTEQKQAIITHAVTKGLNPHAPGARFKPSGIDWLGDVPAHWDVQRLKWLSHIKTGGRDTVHRKDDAAYPFFVRSQTVERIDTYSFDGEAVLTAGDGAGVAKVFHYVNGKFDYHQRVYKFSHFRRVRAKFFFHYFSVTLRFEAFRETAKSTVDSLRLPMLQDFPVPIPPFDEQDAIVAYVEEQTRGINQSIALLRREIDLIREYRTRLVADVVTGKVDVRAAASLFEEEVQDVAVPDLGSETADEGDEVGDADPDEADATEEVDA